MHQCWNFPDNIILTSQRKVSDLCAWAMPCWTMCERFQNTENFAYAPPSRSPKDYRVILIIVFLPGARVPSGKWHLGDFAAEDAHAESGPHHGRVAGPRLLLRRMVSLKSTNLSGGFGGMQCCNCEYAGTRTRARARGCWWTPWTRTTWPRTCGRWKRAFPPQGLVYVYLIWCLKIWWKKNLHESSIHNLAERIKYFLMKDYEKVDSEFIHPLLEAQL